MEYIWIDYRNDKELTFEKRFWMWFEPCILYTFKWKVESGMWKENAINQKRRAKGIGTRLFPLSNRLNMRQNGVKKVCPFLVLFFAPIVYCKIIIFYPLRFSFPTVQLTTVF